MEEQIEKEYHTPILVEDLGMRFPTENSKKKKRFGLFKCFVVMSLRHELLM